METQPQTNGDATTVGGQKPLLDNSIDWDRITVKAKVWYLYYVARYSEGHYKNYIFLWRDSNDIPSASRSLSHLSSGAHSNTEEGPKRPKHLDKNACSFPPYSVTMDPTKNMYWEIHRGQQSVPVQSKIVSKKDVIITSWRCWKCGNVHLLL